MTAFNGLLCAADTMLPQLYGSKNIKQFGLVFQKGNTKLFITHISNNTFNRLYLFKFKACFINILASIICVCFLLNSKIFFVLFVQDHEIVE